MTFLRIPALAHFVLGWVNMTTPPNHLWERITTTVRCFFNRSIPPEAILKRKQEELAAIQAEGSKAAHRREKLRWEDEGGAVAETTGVHAPLGAKR